MTVGKELDAWLSRPKQPVPPRTYRPPLVPVERGADIAVARWLARESFEQTAASDGRRITEYTEREVPADEVLAQFRVPPGESPARYVAAQLGRPHTDFVWFEFHAVGEFLQDVYDWLGAQSAWERDQYAEWLEAEAAWRAESDATRV